MSPAILFLVLLNTTSMQNTTQRTETRADQLLLRSPISKSKTFHTPSQAQPADEAPIEDLVQFWLKSDSPNLYNMEPSDRVAERLLAYLKENAKDFPGMVQCETKTDKLAFLKDLFVQIVGDKQYREMTQKARRWFTRNTDNFIEDLVKETREKLLKNPQYGDDELDQLISLSWHDALPLLEMCIQSDNTDLIVLAKSCFFRRDAKRGTDVETLRLFLRHTVEDREASAFSRVRAAHALWDFQGEDFDAWYLGLFKDPTLKRLGELPVYTILRNPVERDPEKWVPKMAALLESQNPTVVHHAATALAQFHGDKFRKDAIKALLPWIDNPEWIEKPSYYPRLRFLQSLERGYFPEAIPALLTAAQTETSYYHQEAIISALVKYRAIEAVPLLKKMLKGLDHPSLQSLIFQFFTLNGWSAEDIVDGLAWCKGEPLRPASLAMDLSDMTMTTPKCTKIFRGPGHALEKFDIKNPSFTEEIIQQTRNRNQPPDKKLSILKSYAGGAIKQLVTC